MASEVQICNLALVEVGAYTISALTENTKEAKMCKLFYETIRDEVLFDHDWNFARKRLTLSLLTDDYSGWVYAYQYPPDCVVARKIYDNSGALTGTVYDSDTDTYKKTGKIEFETAVSSNLNKKIILTNKEDAELIYTAKVSQTSLFSPLFVRALVLKLAASIVIPLRGKANLKSTFLQEYSVMLGQAQAIDANEGHKIPDDNNSLIQARS